MAIMEQTNTSYLGDFLFNKAIPSTGLRPATFAKTAGISRNHLYDLRTGDRRLTPKIAKRLEPLLDGISARTLLQMQLDLDVAQVESRA